MDSCEGNLRELVCSPKAFTVLLIALDYKRLQEMPNQNPNGNRSLEIKRERDCALTSINNKCTAAKSDIGSPPIPPFSKSANSKQQIVNRIFNGFSTTKKHSSFFLIHKLSRSTLWYFKESTQPRMIALYIDSFFAFLLF